ncbi:hypothetical protein HN51_019738 [Arachis hypogaea]
MLIVLDSWLCLVSCFHELAFSQAKPHNFVLKSMILITLKVVIGLRWKLDLCKHSLICLQLISDCCTKSIEKYIWNFGLDKRKAEAISLDVSLVLDVSLEEEAILV